MEQTQQINPQQMTPEQIEALKEKLSKMSPEELKEFQKKQCIFCQIITGRVQAKKVYEDDRTIAILDINPANPGHILLLPKEHYTVMPQMPEEEIANIFVIAKKLSNAVLRALDVKGTNIVVANGPAAGQRAQHFMVNIIPRKENDKINLVLPQNPQKEEELNAIRDKIAGKLGLKEQKQEKVEIDVSKVLKSQPAAVIEEKEEIQEPIEKPIEKNKKPLKKSKKPIKKTKKEGVSLDDIANILK